MATTKKETRNMANKKELSIAEEATKNAVAVPDFGADAGDGFENTTSADIKIPFISLLQALSGPVTSPDSEAKAGMLFNTVTKQIFDGKTGILFVPAMHDHSFTEFEPDGGGFVARHSIADPDICRIVAHAKKNDIYPIKTEKGNTITATTTLWGVVLDEDQSLAGMAAVTFANTKLAKWQGMYASMAYANRKYTAPFYGNVVRLTSAQQTNKKGQVSYNYEINFVRGGMKNAEFLAPGNEAYDAAKMLKQQIESGVASADFASADDGAPTTDSDSDEF